MLMSIGGLVPVPSDALVTPVSFNVRKRQLRGILADFDAAEDGKRELSGEWVVGKRTWRRLQSEWRARKQGKSMDGKGKRKERIVLYLHGGKCSYYRPPTSNTLTTLCVGAYYMFSAATHRLLTIPLAKYLDARLFGRLTVLSFQGGHILTGHSCQLQIGSRNSLPWAPARCRLFVLPVGR